MKKAFTLAEIMIVLVIIGVLIATLLPAIKNSTPDEEVIKFKKTHNAILNAVQELSISDKYFMPGDLTKKPNGAYADCCYHANALADVLNGRVVSCDSSITVAPVSGSSHYCATISDFKTADSDCDSIHNLSEALVRRYIDLGCTNIIELSNKQQVLYSPPFNDSDCIGSDGFSSSFGNIYLSVSDQFNLDYNGDGTLNTMDATRYKRICKGLNEGKIPETFSYAIRADGKVLMSDKVTEWFNKSIKK